MIEPLDYQKTTPPQEEKTIRLVKPSLLVRIKSTFIDTLIIIALMFLASELLERFQIESAIVRGCAFYLIWMYEPISVTFGRTIGQRLTGIRVCKFSTLSEENRKTNINILQSVYRYLLKLFLGWISLLTIQGDQYGRAIHDKLANSVMTKR